MKSIFKRILQALTNFDHKLSGKMHQLDNLLVTIFLYPFAAFFHPGLIWVAYSSIFIISDYNK
jgi:hypothetical protein